MEYRQDERWFVGRLTEVPAVFSQGETLEELESNLRDAYELVLSDMGPPPVSTRTESKPLEVDV